MPKQEKRFYISPENADTSNFIIEGSDFNHIKNVLRLKKEDKIELFDGRGNIYLCKIESYSKKNLKLELLQNSFDKKKKSSQIIIAQSFLKDKTITKSLRMLTELGIYMYMPFLSERSVVRLDAASLEAKKKKFEKIVIESLKQCQRNIKTKIQTVPSLLETLNYGKDYDLKIIFWENEVQKLKDIFKKFEDKKTSKIFLIIGPEGGFSIDEIKLAKELDYQCASLGPRLLKADTASIAAASIVQFYFGDIN